MNSTMQKKKYFNNLNNTELKIATIINKEDFSFKNISTSDKVKLNKLIAEAKTLSRIINDKCCGLTDQEKGKISRWLVQNNINEKVGG